MSDDTYSARYWAARAAKMEEITRALLASLCEIPALSAEVKAGLVYLDRMGDVDATSIIATNKRNAYELALIYRMLDEGPACEPTDDEKPYWSMAHIHLRNCMVLLIEQREAIKDIRQCGFDSQPYKYGLYAQARLERLDKDAYNDAPPRKPGTARH